MKKQLLALKLRRAVRKIARLSPGEVPSVNLLQELQEGWSNEGYAARTDFLQEVARVAATTSGPVLECGSGLTSILVGLLAGRRGVATYSLEHVPEWRARINDTLRALGVEQVKVFDAPLRDYQDFAWYTPPYAELPKEFAFVICDGPPGNTRGGRYGLMPVMGDSLPPGCVILLDDTERASEAEVMRRWAEETKISVAQRETTSGSFAVITRQESPALVEQFEGEGPQVSVIIPAYNVAPYIGETLASVFSQSFTDFEVIVINDGSPDTPQLEHALQPYRDRIVYLQQENGGASLARNAGLRAAKGEFVAFLDADDLWQPDYLAQQLKFLHQGSWDLVCADAMVFGDSPDAGVSYMDHLMPTAPLSGIVTFLELAGAERSLITSGVVVRRDWVLQVGMFDKSLRNAQDFDLWLRLARAGARLAFQRRVLLRYRARTDSLSGDETNSLIRELRVLDKIQHSYNLTAAERAETGPVIRARQSLLQFELGKHLLARGDINQARKAFADADNARRSWKTRAATSMALLAPRVMQTICQRRIQHPTKASLGEEVLGT